MQLLTILLIFCAGTLSSAWAAESLRAELKSDRVVIHVGDRLFTEYLFLSDSKYPYFYPVNGPATGRSVTIHKTEPYPHHSSLFFGCDRVNGGNYWQEGLDRGRIISKDLKLSKASGKQIVFEQSCDWERPGAESPFKDRRTLTISAPSSTLRCIDFDVTLTAKTKVRIEKNNHSLFAARVAPEISVKGGGSLINAAGAQGEKGTFAQPSPWADYRGTRDGQVEGIAIFAHPKNRWSPAPWFTRDYGFFSPTPMNWLENGHIEFVPGETLHLRYRALIHAGALSQSELDAEFKRWVAEE